MNVDTQKVTRVEIISQHGREYVNMSAEAVTLSMQDNDTTLKIFLQSNSKNLLP